MKNILTALFAQPQVKQTILWTSEKDRQNAIIEEIHDTFFTEVDRLLAEAKISHSLDTNMQAQIDKADRLKKLGITSSKEVTAVQTELKRLRDLQKENDAKSKLIESIEYFSQKYPHYKFITEDSVKKICQKYGLVYGGIGNYTGTVPEKNLQQMEAFKIDEGDKCMIIDIRNYYTSLLGNMEMFEKVQQQYRKESDIINTASPAVRNEALSRGHYPPQGRVYELYIAAPRTDFNMEGKIISDHKVVDVPVPDPVVLQPVYHNGLMHYLVVTAWGLEGSDELVVNERNN